MTERPRNKTFEREVILEACRGSWFDPMDVIEHAQARADNMGNRVRVGPRWLLEAMEEIPDFNNYVGWDLEENFDAEDREQLMLAISEASSAYERVRRVRARRRP